MKRSYKNEVQDKLSSLNVQIETRVLGNISSGKTFIPVYYVNAGQNKKPRVLLSTGIHGDEPAGVYALIEFLKGPIVDYLDKLNFSIFPCLNPWGFEHDKRTNLYGVDINRSFVKNNSVIALILKRQIAANPNYTLAINLHEDNTQIQVDGFPKEENPRAFYLYDNSRELQNFGASIINKLRTQGIEICNNETIYGEKNNQGVIVSIPSKGEFEEFLRRHTNRIIVTENPTCWPLEKRVSVQLKALLTALDFAVSE